MWAGVGNPLGFVLAVPVMGILGYVAEALIPGEKMDGGWMLAMAAGLIGSWAGMHLLGNFGPTVAGFAPLPSVIGAAPVVGLVVALMRMAQGAPPAPRSEEDRYQSQTYTLRTRKRAS